MNASVSTFSSISSSFIPSSTNVSSLNSGAVHSASIVAVPSISSTVLISSSGAVQSASAVSAASLSSTILVSSPGAVLSASAIAVPSSSTIPVSSSSSTEELSSTQIGISSSATIIKVSSKVSLAHAAVASPTGSVSVGSISSVPSTTSQVSSTSQSASTSSLSPTTMSSTSDAPAKTDAASDPTSTGPSAASVSSSSPSSASTHPSSEASSSSSSTSSVDVTNQAPVSTTQASTSDSSKTTSDSASSSTENSPNQATSGSKGSAGTPSPTSTQQSGTTTSVIVVTNSSSRSTMTSTITDKPDSTFSTPVGGVTVTNSANGQKSVSFPALVTVLSTSEAADGQLLTFTHTVANPTGVVSGQNISNHSFLQNEGAVAGVFTAVGIVATALAVCIFMLCRRRRRRHNRKHRWITDIQRRLPEPDNPFEDPRHAPVVRTVDLGNHATYNATPPASAHPLLDEEKADPLTAGPSTSAGSPFGYSHAHRASNAREEHEIGLAVTTNSPRYPSRPSLAQSSPSIYPPSLPSERDDASSVYEDLNLHHPVLEPQQVGQHGQKQAVATTPTPTGEAPTSDSNLFSPIGTGTGYGHKRELTGGSISPVPPARPPRSVLRQVPPKGLSLEFNYNPLTPPPSVSSHGHPPSNPPSPITGMPAAAATDMERQGPILGGDYGHGGYETSYDKPPSSSKGIEDIFLRRTLLDIRPRPSRDDMDK